MSTAGELRSVEWLVSWQKDCDCKGTASTGQFRSRETGRGMEYINIAVQYYPGPLCDVCGKPWVQAPNTKPAPTFTED
jgi:hypothetical protein